MKRRPSGLAAWLVQRTSAVTMLLFTVGLLLFFGLYPPHSYADWKNWGAQPAAPLALGLFFLALLAHMWVGLRDVLLCIKAQDNSLWMRKSCREGVWCSDAMNINGSNGLACTTRSRNLKKPVVLRPLPSFPIVCDLVVGMTNFFKQYHYIKPCLVNEQPTPEKKRLQLPAEREKLNGAYECILCACCSSQCPLFWWNPDKVVDPPG